ncbi:MAG: hypothetical protein RIG84_09985 [Roseovarius sp.]
MTATMMPTATTTEFTIFDTATEALAAEMALLEAVASGRAGGSAFLWQARRPALVLPERFTRAPGFGAAAAECARAGWPVVPRRTGGGITPQGPGLLNLAMAFHSGPGHAHSVQEGYEAICAPLEEALAALGIEARATPVSGSFCDGDYNLAVSGRKLVGTAQRRRGNACLCHALVITDLALAPAIAAIRHLSDSIGQGLPFRLDAHCRLADLVSGQAVGPPSRSETKPKDRAAATPRPDQITAHGINAQAHPGAQPEPMPEGHPPLGTQGAGRQDHAPQRDDQPDRERTMPQAEPRALPSNARLEAQPEPIAGGPPRPGSGVTPGGPEAAQGHSSSDPAQGHAPFDPVASMLARALWPALTRRGFEPIDPALHIALK